MAIYSARLPISSSGSLTSPALDIVTVADDVPVLYSAGAPEGLRAAETPTVPPPVKRSGLAAGFLGRGPCAREREARERTMAARSFIFERGGLVVVVVLGGGVVVMLRYFPSTSVRSRGTKEVVGCRSARERSRAGLGDGGETCDAPIMTSLAAKCSALLCSAPAQISCRSGESWVQVVIFGICPTAAYYIILVSIFERLTSSWSTYLPCTTSLIRRLSRYEAPGLLYMAVVRKLSISSCLIDCPRIVRPTPLFFPTPTPHPRYYHGRKHTARLSLWLSPPHIIVLLRPSFVTT